MRSASSAPSWRAAHSSSPDAVGCWAARARIESGIEVTTKAIVGTVYYSLDVELWYERTRRALSTLTVFQDLLADGVELLGANERRARRLVEVHDLYTEMEQDLQGLWERWESRRKRR
ncbi:MAG: hypothetical protein M3Y89_18375 [Actinomycetota bacterium]|nr:hypothetical protein [Actinomycetota bacterium]